MHYDYCDTFTTRIRPKGFKKNTPNTFVKYEKNARKQTVSHFSESGKKVAIFLSFRWFFYSRMLIVYRQFFGNFQKVATIGGFYLIFGFILTFYSILSGSLHNVSTSTPRRGSQSSITSPFSDTPRPAPKRQPATPTSARRGVGTSQTAEWHQQQSHERYKPYLMYKLARSKV